MIIRQEYLDRIQPFIGKPVIKAVTGLRRVGKSVFIRQIINQLKQNGIAEKNIVYVDIESLEFDFIRTYQDLNRYLLEKTADVAGKIYVFIDEIQDISEWERTIASWSGQPDRYDVTITGSNSTMFSGQLSTKLTGRYIEFPIYPLSLREFRDFFPEFSDNEKLFDNYLRYGGLPGLRILDELRDETVLPFLRSIHDTIVLKDIVARRNIRNTSLLADICRFIYDNISKPLTASSISAYLKNQKISVTVPSVINYLTGLVDSQLFYKAYRFDLKGKRQLEINNKYYAADLGLRHSQIGYRSSDISYLMENLVYLELLRCYDQVYTGEMGKWEVDFVALKNAKPHYFQVTMNLAEPAVIERETRSLLAIQDNFPKTIITYDKIHGDGIAGIEVVNLMDFLLEAY
ncbi:ATP-binding protein [Victivallis vadensis]|uniref:ATP-binding protein n=1 Tax=Victivallis vadensis TaxID=172901 RepID=UPI00307F98D4